METRKCPCCKKTKNVSEFTKNKRTSHGYDYYCKVCNSIKHRRHRENNPEKYKSTITQVRKYSTIQEARRAERLKRYGLTFETFEELLKIQNNKCATCLIEFESRKKVHIDHCHLSGKTRGLLCHNCNVALGHIKDNITTLNNMLKYLSI